MKWVLLGIYLGVFNPSKVYDRPFLMKSFKPTYMRANSVIDIIGDVHIKQKIKGMTSAPKEHFCEVVLEKVAGESGEFVTIGESCESLIGRLNEKQ